MTTHALKLASPGDLLATVPYLFGFHPTDSLVVICLHGNRMGLLARIDLPHPDELTPTVATLLPAIQSDHPDTAILIGYDDTDGHSLPALQAMKQGLCLLGVAVKDRLVVCDGRWFSIDCHDPGCCPPFGAPVPEPADTARLAAEFVGHELCPHPDRASLAGQLEPGLQSVPVQKALQRLDRDPRPARSLAEAFAPWPRILDARDDAPPITVADAAGAADSLRDVHLRDGLIAWLTPGTLGMDLFSQELQDLVCGLQRGWDEHQGDSRSVIAQNRVQARLITVCAMLPDHAAAPALTVLASFAWWRGNGALTRVALDRALRCDPGYRLAGLLERMLDLGIRPVPA